jgi:hypothetical protein
LFEAGEQIPRFARDDKPRKSARDDNSFLKEERRAMVKSEWRMAEAKSNDEERRANGE